MNITREELLEFLKSEGVQASYILDEDYNIAVDAFFARLAQESSDVSLSPGDSFCINADGSAVVTRSNGTEETFYPEDGKVVVKF